MSDTRPVVFSFAELWLLHRFVRHEAPHERDWRYPPAAFDLNSQLASAILRCERLDLDEAPLQLTLADCLVIDACVANDLRDAGGNSIARALLVKVFAAREALMVGYPLPDAAEPAVPTKLEVQALLKQQAEEERR